MKIILKANLNIYTVIQNWFHTDTLFRYARINFLDTLFDKFVFFSYYSGHYLLETNPKLSKLAFFIRWRTSDEQSCKKLYVNVYAHV